MGFFVWIFFSTVFFINTEHSVFNSVYFIAIERISSFDIIRNEAVLHSLKEDMVMNMKKPVVPEEKSIITSKDGWEDIGGGSSNIGAGFGDIVLVQVVSVEGIGV